MPRQHDQVGAARAAPRRGSAACGRPTRTSPSAVGAGARACSNARPARLRVCAGARRPRRRRPRVSGSSQSAATAAARRQPASSGAPRVDGRPARAAPHARVARRTSTLQGAWATTLLTISPSSRLARKPRWPRRRMTIRSARALARLVDDLEIGFGTVAHLYDQRTPCGSGARLQACACPPPRHRRAPRVRAPRPRIPGC